MWIHIAYFTSGLLVGIGISGGYRKLMLILRCMEIAHNTIVVPRPGEGAEIAARQRKAIAWRIAQLEYKK